MPYNGLQVLSDLVVFSKYAQYRPDLLTRESWDQIVDRRCAMDVERFPEYEKEIRALYDDYVRPKKVLASMRSFQFAGKAIDMNEVRGFNCSYQAAKTIRVFRETMFLLLSGTGCGYSVQRHHVAELPPVKGCKEGRPYKFVIEDSLMGWAGAVDALIKAYFEGRPRPRFVFDEIREKGARLVTSGGKAPGPEPLRVCLAKLEAILEKARGRQLRPIEVHDMQCHIANSVLAGGIRRAALICLFSPDDEEMLTCKHGEWWVENEQRGRANNSAVFLRTETAYEQFKAFMKYVKDSGCGEPGWMWVDDLEYGGNPCFRGDMRVLTSDGYKTFKELQDQEVLLVNADSEEVPGKVWCSGVKRIYKIAQQLKGGVNAKSIAPIFCTEDHQFRTTKGLIVTAKNLKGHKIEPFIPSLRHNPLWLKLGFIQGDACLTDLNNPTKRGLCINIGKDEQDIRDLFEVAVDDTGTYYQRGYNEILEELGFEKVTLPHRGLPETFKSWDVDQCAAFLSGLYSANGSALVVGRRITLKTTCRKLVDQVAEVLSSQFGIDTYITTNKAKRNKFKNGEYICRESYDLNIATYHGLAAFAGKIGFIQKNKTKRLKEIIFDKAPVVTAVEDTREDSEVFDFTLRDQKHWGVVEGVIAHNCLEILFTYSPGFCNLTEVNCDGLTSQEEFNARCRAGAMLGTLQAAYTDFHYLDPEWRDSAEKEALLGVSLTGQAHRSFYDLNLREGANHVVLENEKWAKKLGIQTAARATCTKPSGTASCVLGTSSGVHRWHDLHYIRRMRVGKNEALYQYMVRVNPKFVEDDVFRPETQAVISIPIKAPDDAITRIEDLDAFLAHVKMVNEEWVHPGRRRGIGNHNVSATASVREHEWGTLLEWAWKNRFSYTGLSVLPYDGGTYTQAPFETITSEAYEDLVKLWNPIDVTEIVEYESHTDFVGEAACSGGSCEVV